MADETKTGVDVGKSTSVCAIPIRKGMMLGCGNPLLDISVHTDAKFLEKYCLKPNNAILAEEKHLPMYDELKAMPGVEYIAGGSTQNTLRVFQWVLGGKEAPQAGCFMGSVGTDENAKILKQKAEECGLRIEYQENSKYPTGTCAVLVTGQERSLCANLAAANHFTIDHIQKKENDCILKDACFAYVSCFFLTFSAETALHIGKHCHETEGKVFVMNIGAIFLAHAFKDQMMACMPYVDILFGNDEEFAAIAEANKFPVDPKDFLAVAKHVSMLEHKGTVRRMVVVTRGTEPVSVVCGNTVKQYPIVKLPKEKIVDTNGAGDAFAGGFMAMYVQGKTVDVAVRCGTYCASELIQRSGCSLPEKMLFKE